MPNTCARLNGLVPACLLKVVVWLHRPLFIELLMLAGAIELIVLEVRR